MENAAIVIKLAWRNVWRNRRRTILTLLTIVVGCAMIIFLNAIAKGGHDRMIEDAISINTGHIQIHEKGFWDNLTIDYAFRPSRDLIHELESNPHVAAYSQRIHAAALLSFGDTSTGAIIQGVEPRREQNVTTLHSKILPGGRYLKKGDTKSMLLGVTLAQNLGASTGKQIALISQGFDGSIAADMFTVTGLIQSGNPEYDKMLAVIPFTQANRTFAMMDYIHAITVRLHSSDTTEQVVRSLQSRSAGGDTQLEVMGWDRLMPVLVQFIIMDDVSAYIFDFILLMLVAFGILNTIQMSVFERTREFGIMLSIGTRPGQVTAIVLAESVFISTLGILLGIALGLLVSWYFALNPMDYSSMAAETAVWGVSISTMPADATATNVAVTSLLTFVFAMLFSVFPARRAAKLNPVDAVRQL